MNILVPAAIAFAAIIPIILLLYFMRPKRQERVVGSTFLWQQALQDLQASRPWQRLRITPLLLLQLLAACVIVFILTRPAIFISSPISGNSVIILQASASMQAKDVAPSRFESAKNNIDDMIDALGSGDHIALISMARIPQVLATQSQDKTYLHNAVHNAHVTNQDADLEAALSLATALSSGQSNTQILVIGDGHILNSNNQSLVVPLPVHYLTVGTDAPNVALLALAARSQQGKQIAFAQVANYSHQTRAIPVELYADNKLVGVKTISLLAGASSSVQWDTIPATTRFLNARLISQDAMSVDHEAWAIVGGSIHGRVLLVTKENHFLETVLRLQPNIELYETTPDTYKNTTTAYDLTVFDGFSPPQLPTGNLLFLNPPTGSYLFGTSAQPTLVTHINAGSDTIKLLSNIDLSNIHVIHATHPLKPATWAQTIISTPETPLLIAGQSNNRRVVVIGFDLHDSDLPLQPAFPLLMNNISNWLLPPPVAGDGTVTAGAPVGVQTWPGTDHVSITGPDQQTTTIGPPFPVAPYTKTDSIGIYQIIQHVQNRTLAGAFTVNLFDANQSNLAPAKTLPVLNSSKVTASGSGNSISRQLREVWPWIAAFLLLVLCAEWWLFSRSYKQQTATAQRQGATTRRWQQEKARARPMFVMMLQEQWQRRYQHVRKRTLKTTKRIRGKLTKQPKGDRHVNI